MWTEKHGQDNNASNYKPSIGRPKSVMMRTVLKNDCHVLSSMSEPSQNCCQQLTAKKQTLQALAWRSFRRLPSSAVDLVPFVCSPWWLMTAATSLKRLFLASVSWFEQPKPCGIEHTRSCSQIMAGASFGHAYCKGNINYYKLRARVVGWGICISQSGFSI